MITKKITELYDFEKKTKSGLPTFAGAKKLSLKDYQRLFESPGVYLIRDTGSKRKSKIIYIGMTGGSLRKRLRTHLQKASGHFVHAQDTENWDIYRRESRRVGWKNWIVTFQRRANMSERKKLEKDLIAQHFKKFGDAPVCNCEYLSPPISEARIELCDEILGE